MLPPGQQASRATIADADTAFTTVRPTNPFAESIAPYQPPVTLTVLHVQVPREQREQSLRIWNHLREEVLDSQTALVLRDNGVRVGVGNERWWDSLRTVLAMVDGIRVHEPATVNLMADFPLVLELDVEPRHQTLFSIDREGRLSGDVWPASRNVLRVSCAADVQFSGHCRLRVAPAVVRRLEGSGWEPGAGGAWQLAPNRREQVFADAAFALRMAPGEFMVIAAGENARVGGLLGQAFFTTAVDGRPYDSIFFLRPELKHDAERG